MRSWDGTRLSDCCVNSPTRFALADLKGEAIRQCISWLPVVVVYTFSTNNRRCQSNRGAYPNATDRRAGTGIVNESSCHRRGWNQRQDAGLRTRGTAEVFLRKALNGQADGWRSTKASRGLEV